MAETSYTSMATTVTAAASALSQAAAGRRLPRQDTVRDYVKACCGTDDHMARAVQLWRAAARHTKGQRTTEIPDPANVHTPQQFTDAITALLEEAGLFGARAIANATARIGPALSRTTVSRWLSHSTSVMSTAMLDILLAICDTPTGQYEAWKQARSRAALNAAGLHTPPAAKRKKKPVAGPGQEPGVAAGVPTTRMLTVVPPLARRPSPEPDQDVLVGELVNEDELVPELALNLGFDSSLRRNSITSSRAALDVSTDILTPGPRFTATSESLLDELQALCRGQGVQAPGIDRQIGPALQEVCDIVASDGPEAVRVKIDRWVIRIIDQFPDELKLAVLAPLGLHPQARSRFLSERVAWLSTLLDRSPRTTRRRIYVGLIRLVEAALGGDAPFKELAPEKGWRLIEFEAQLRLDGPTPTCVEHRTIRAERDDVDEVVWSITLPTVDDNDTLGDLDVTALHGVELITSERSPSQQRFFLRLRLPRPLKAGQTHQFSLEVRVPMNQQTRPVYMYWPEEGCDLFRLAARFPAGQPPAALWRVDGARHRDTDDDHEGHHLLAVNEIGEVAVSFPNMRPGLGYGIQWRQETQGLPAVIPHRLPLIPRQDNAKAANDA